MVSAGGGFDGGVALASGAALVMGVRNGGRRSGGEVWVDGGGWGCRAAAVSAGSGFDGGGWRLGTGEDEAAAGAERVVIGTAAVRDPAMLAAVCGEHGGERVVVAVDARDGVVAVEGWTESGQVTASELGRRIAGLEVARLLYTDIARDGMMSGPDLDHSARLARETGMAVLASGGAEDIRSLASTGVERALYTGAVGLAEAIAAVGGKGGGLSLGGAGLMAGFIAVRNGGNRAAIAAASSG